jgi:DNA polymerase-4
VGISTNRFLAKTAASLHKPNGLDVITHDNLRDVFSKLELTDLTGIAGRFEKRLNAVGIFTPLQFLDADSVTLKKVVFKSVVGLEWHQRLRGWEVDKRDFPIRTAGRQYVLDAYKMPRHEVLKRLHHLCEETGSKVRSQGLVARGVSVHARSYSDTGRGWGGTYWHARSMAATPFFSNQAIYEQAKKLFEAAPVFVKEIGVSCYELSEPDDSQLHLFGDELASDRAITTAIDEINARYGKRIVHSADTLTTKMMREKIPFGSTRYM